MAKLTLSVDLKVVQQAKRYARSRGTSISRLVEGYLELISRPRVEITAEPPVLRELRGVLRRGSTSDYCHHVIRSHR